MLRLSAEEMETLAERRARLDAELEIVSQRKMELEEQAERLDHLIDVIDKVMDSTEVIYG